MLTDEEFLTLNAVVAAGYSLSLSMESGVQTSILRLSARLILICCLLAAVRPALAIDPAKLSEAEETQISGETSSVYKYDDFLSFLERLEARLVESKQTPLFSPRPAVIPFNDLASISGHYLQSEEKLVHCLLLELILCNTTTEEQVFNPATLVLEANGVRHTQKEIPAELRETIFNLGGRYSPISEAIHSRPVKLPPRSVTLLPVAFQIDFGTEPVPSLLLSMELKTSATDSGVVTLDLNKHSAANLDLKIDRIGPGGCCALIRLHGVLDFINAEILSSKLKELVDAGVQRFIVDLDLQSKDFGRGYVSWLLTMMVQEEYEDRTDPKPAFPSGVLVMELVARKSLFPEEVYQEHKARVHDTVDQAITAALLTAFRGATREMVLEQLERGDVRERPATLIGGANVFRVSDTPRLIPYLTDPDRATRQAVCQVIARMDDDRSRTLLEYQVRTAEPELAEVALEALLKSRVEANVRVGIKAAQGATSIPPSRLLATMVRSRHPIFRDYVRQAAIEGTTEVRVLAYQSLAGTFGTDAAALFSAGFAASEPAIQNAAFQAASRRMLQGDLSIRPILLNETVRRLTLNPADEQALPVASSLRDIRFVPVAMKVLQAPGTTSQVRQTWLDLLGRLGSPEAMDFLANHVSKMSSDEQDIALGHLSRQDPQKALELAKQEMLRDDVPVREGVSRILVGEGSDEAVRLLQNRIRIGEGDQTRRVLNALSLIGSPLAIAVLECEFSKGPLEYQMEVLQALQGYWNRSPALSATTEGVELVNRSVPAAREDLEEAMTLFESARELDPLFPGVYRGRGNARLRTEDWEGAACDFAACLELNPLDEISLTGRAIALVMLGREAEAFESLTAAESRFDQMAGVNTNFNYNVACAYARAIEKLKKQPKTPESDAEIQRLSEIAFTKLNRSIELGFSDLRLLKSDPDLVSLHDDPRFLKAVEAAMNSPSGEEL